MGQVCFGVDVGGTTVKLGLFSMDGSLHSKWEITTRKIENGKYILEDVADSIGKKIIELKLKMEDIIGVGVGIPGPVKRDGVVLRCVNLGWGVFNVEEELGKLTGLKIKAANDANIAALGEMWQGGGKGYRNIVLITLGTGVGGGIIVDGNILAGSNGAAGEIGHSFVNKEEKDSCSCGNSGCLEQYASATGIVKETHRLLNKTEEPSVLRDLEEITAKDIFDCAKAGDHLANISVENLCYYLGVELTHVACVLDPEAFVLGGGVSKAGSILTDLVKKYYEEHVMFALKGKEFKLATLGNDAGIYGGAKLILDTL